MHVNNTPLAPPFVIEAIGDIETLYNGINIQPGILDDLRRINPEMVKMEKVKNLSIPGFAGSTQIAHGKNSKKVDKEKPSEPEPTGGAEANTP